MKTLLELYFQKFQEWKTTEDPQQKKLLCVELEDFQNILDKHFGLL